MKLTTKTNNSGKLIPRLANPPILPPLMIHSKNEVSPEMCYARKTKNMASPARENTAMTIAIIMAAKLAGNPPSPMVHPPYLTTIARMIQTIRT